MPHTDIHIVSQLITSSVCNLATQRLLTRSQNHRVLQILNAAPILYHAVTSNPWTFTHNYYIQWSHVQAHVISSRVSVLQLPSTEGYLISRVIFRFFLIRWIWFYSIYVGFRQPPNLACIQSVVDRSCEHLAFRIQLFCHTRQGVHLFQCTRKHSKWQLRTAMLDISINHWSYLFWTYQNASWIASFSTMCNFLHHSASYSVAPNLIFTAYTLSPTFPNILSLLQQMEPTCSQVRNQYSQRNQKAQLERALQFKKALSSETELRIEVNELLLDQSYLLKVMDDKNSWFTQMEMLDLI